jgi:hypothetical protein
VNKPADLVLKRSGDVTTAGRFRLTKTGMEVDGEATFAEWHSLGMFLREAQERVQWWVGDWLNYGEKRAWGEMYTEAVEATGLEEGTLRDLAWTSRQFDLSRRHDNLSFKHHREVAALPPEQADGILDKAEAAIETTGKPLSTREVRAMVREAKTAATQQPSPPAPELAPTEEFRLIYRWLEARRDAWPESVRGEFRGFVENVLDKLEVADGDD